MSPKSLKPRAPSRSRSPRGRMNAARADGNDTHLWPMGLSPAGFKLLQMWSQGGAAATTLQELAQSMVQTCGHSASDVSKLSSICACGNQPSHCQRDLLKMDQLANIPVPEPREVEAYVFKHKGGEVTIEKSTVWYFSICDWYDALEKHGLVEQVLGPISEIAEFWSHVSPKDPKMHKNPVKNVKGYNKLFRPFELHGDAGPHQKHDSCNVYTMRSLLAPESVSVEESSLLISAIPQSARVTFNKCKELKIQDQFVEDTWAPIWRAMVDDLNKFFESKRGLIWIATQDCEHLAKDYDLPHYGTNEKPCMRCKCNQGADATMPITDVSKGAKFRKHYHTPEELAKKPLTNHWLLQVKGFSHYTWVYDPMHCKEIGATSHAIANVFYDVVFKELHGMRTNASKLKKLNELISQGYNEMGVLPERRISFPTELKHFCDPSAPHKHYPDLMHSAIKARQTRYLVPVAFWLASHFKDSSKCASSYARRRYFCLKNLSRLYEIEDSHRLFLPSKESTEYMDCTQKFLEHYVHLASESATSLEQVGSFQWSFVPKFHFMIHIAEDAQFLSPRAFWAYRGESMVGTIAKIAASCLAGMPAYRVNETLCIKYRIAKYLQFLLMRM